MRIYIHCSFGAAFEPSLSRPEVCPSRAVFTITVFERGDCVHDDCRAVFTRSVSVVLLV